MMDIMALLNCSINFVLFCIMSIQFRKTFHKVLGTKQIINKYFASSPEVNFNSMRAAYCQTVIIMSLFQCFMSTLWQSMKVIMADILLTYNWFCQLCNYLANRQGGFGFKFGPPNTHFSLVCRVLKNQICDVIKLGRWEEK